MRFTGLWFLIFILIGLWSQRITTISANTRSVAKALSASGKVSSQHITAYPTPLGTSSTTMLMSVYCLVVQTQPPILSNSKF